MKPRSRAADILALLAASGLLVWFLCSRRLERPSEALLVTSIFAIGAFALKGVNVSGAAAGAMLGFIFYEAGDWQLFACLVAAFLTTFISTKAGAKRKESLGLGEPRTGRSAVQIVSNLGVSGSLLVYATLVISREPDKHFLPLVMAIAALAQATADTASSEIGEAYGGTPLLITTLKKASIGTDGAITLLGTTAGAAAALVVAGAFRVFVGMHGFELAALITTAAVLGMFVDSVLGATLERRGWISNNTVNLLGTASASALLWLLLILIGYNLRLVA
jgi:uncharacterized protein (TIGR00297 family)